MSGLAQSTVRFCYNSVSRSYHLINALHWREFWSVIFRWCFEMQKDFSNGQRYISYTWSRSQYPLNVVPWFLVLRGQSLGNPWRYYTNSLCITSPTSSSSNGTRRGSGPRMKTSHWMRLFILPKLKQPFGSSRKSTDLPHPIIILLDSGRWIHCIKLLLILLYRKCTFKGLNFGKVSLFNVTRHICSFPALPEFSVLVYNYAVYPHFFTINATGMQPPFWRKWGLSLSLTAITRSYTADTNFTSAWQ